MKSFKLEPTAFKEIKRKAFIKVAPLLLIAIFAGIFVSEFNQSSGSSDFLTIGIILVGAIALGIFGVFRGFKQRQDVWNSFELIVDENSITRHEKNTPIITIDRVDITEIISYSNGLIFIKSKNPRNFIYVHKSIQNRDELLELLTYYCGITEQVAKSKSYLFYVFPLLTLALFFIHFITKNHPILLITGALLSTGLIWSFIKTQRNKHIDKKIKRTSYLIFIVLLSVLGRMFYALTILF